MPPCPSRQTLYASITEDDESLSGQNRSCPGSPRSRRRDGGRGEDVSPAVGRHLTNHAVLDSAHHFPPFLIASSWQPSADHGEKQVTRGEIWDATSINKRGRAMTDTC